MRIYVAITVSAFLLASCATMKLQVPAKFAEQATQLHVKGSKNRTISFGNYQRSQVERGWDQSVIPGEGNIQSLFTMREPGISGKAGNKFHFTLTNGKLSTVVLFKESIVREKDPKQLQGLRSIAFSRSSNHEYKLAGIIREQETTDTSVWQFYIHTWYDHMHDTTRNIFKLPFTDEERFISNGKETITIRAIRVQTVQGKNKEGDMPIKLLSGFEFRMDDGVVAIVDTRQGDIWLYNDLDDKTKLIITSAATIILHRKVNVE